MVGWKSDNMNSGTLGFGIALWRGLGVGGGGGSNVIIIILFHVLFLHIGAYSPLVS